MEKETTPLADITLNEVATRPRLGGRDRPRSWGKTVYFRAEAGWPPAPVSAAVYVDGLYVGRTPFSVHVPRGLHRYTLFAYGFAVVDGAFTVDGAGVPVIDIQTRLKKREPEPGYIDVTIQTTPSGATVTLEEQFFGTTPVTVSMSEAAAARAVFTIAFPGFKTVTVAAEHLLPGGARPLLINLMMVPSSVLPPSPTNRAMAQLRAREAADQATRWMAGDRARDRVRDLASIMTTHHETTISIPNITATPFPREFRPREPAPSPALVAHLRRNMTLGDIVAVGKPIGVAEILAMGVGGIFAIASPAVAGKVMRMELWRRRAPGGLAPGGGFDLLFAVGDGIPVGSFEGTRYFADRLASRAVAVLVDAGDVIVTPPVTPMNDIVMPSELAADRGVYGPVCDSGWHTFGDDL